MASTGASHSGTGGGECPPGRGACRASGTRCIGRAAAPAEAPPDTGGNTATTSNPETGVLSSAGWPLTHTREEASTAVNRSPKRPRASSRTSATVDPSRSTRAIPAASRADANRRRVGI